MHTHTRTHATHARAHTHTHTHTGAAQIRNFAFTRTHCDLSATHAHTGWHARRGHEFGPWLSHCVGWGRRSGVPTLSSLQFVRNPPPYHLPPMQIRFSSKQLSIFRRVRKSDWRFSGKQLSIFDFLVNSFRFSIFRRVRKSGNVIKSVRSCSDGLSLCFSDGLFLHYEF